MTPKSVTLNKRQSIRLLMGFVSTLCFSNLFAQCMYYPIPVEQRVSKARYIVLAKVTEKHTYIEPKTGNVNTLNKLSVNAWLKNYNGAEEIYVITLGGIYGNIATRVNPSLQLNQQQEYVLMLEDNNQGSDDKNFRTIHPRAIQVFTYADAQGCLTNYNNTYFDMADRSTKTEQELFQKIQHLTGQQVLNKSGEVFQARKPLENNDNIQIEAIGGFSPSTTHAGTIVPGDFITITGSGFGASPGAVYFSNADNGGASLISNGQASDITSWSAGSITVKVPDFAGTGPINVNGTFTSGSSLTIDYSHTAINDNFSGFASATRQRYYFRNMNTQGGYTYRYNTPSGFSSNAPAQAAFQRALISWRCATGMNWRIGANTTVGLLNDNINVVMFDNTLPPGVLARATSNFAGSANGSCNMANTVWCANDLDIQFFTDPPVSGFPWEYGPATPSSSEYDFESVALHELGHHHGLNHVINPGAVMHWALANGAFNRTLSANDIAGGNARIAYSTTATCFNPGVALCGTGPMTTIGVGACATLPVSLLSFTGERSSFSSNKLKWATAQEINSRAFYIQRSTNGTSFTDIDVVNAAGNSSQTIQYTYDDKKAGPYAWYYRLRMQDDDNTEKLSSVIFIDGEKSTQWKVWSGEKGDQIYLYNGMPSSNNALLKVYSANGQLVLTKTLSTGAYEINVSNFSKGIYHYQLSYDGKIMNGKLLLGAD